MKMIPVTSSNIAEIGYEPADRYLFVQFAKDTFRYEDVSPETWGAFLGAESKGKYFAANIKGKYQSFKVPALMAEPDDDLPKGPYPEHFSFIEGPFELSDLPCIVRHDRNGDEDHVLAQMKRVNNPDALREICRLANLMIDQEAAAK